MLCNKKVFIFGSILFIGLCLANPVISQDEQEIEYDDDYYDFYEDDEEIPGAIVFYTTTTTTTTTVSTTTTTTMSTTATTTVSTTTTSETVEVIKPVAEDDFSQSLNQKNVEIIKKPIDESDIIYDDNEDVYDEGYDEDYIEPNQAEKVKIEEEEDEAEDNLETSTRIFNKIHDNLQAKISNTKVEDGQENQMMKAAKVQDSDDVKTEKSKFDLNQMYVIVPVASVVFVALLVGTVLILAKSTNIFRKKNKENTTETRKQIYKSVAQQEPIV